MAAARLHHPNIVTAHDADQAGGLHFLVMEYVEGQTLAEYLAAYGPPPWGHTCEYVRQAALGLQHACEQGMVHRDVKPHNLMLTPEGEVKILDFGLARLGGFAEEPVAPATESAAPPAGATTGPLTTTGTVIGSCDYMAPEQAGDAHRADIRADIYSLGCTLYHLLSGRPPFPGGTSWDKLARHAGEEPEPLNRLRPDLPPGLSAVVRKMTAKAAADRYQTPAEAAAALAPFAVKAVPPRRRASHLAPSARRPGRRKTIFAVLAVALIALVVAVVLGVFGSPCVGRRRPRPQSGRQTPMRRRRRRT